LQGSFAKETCVFKEGGSSWPFAGVAFKCVTHGAPAHLDVTLLMEFPIGRIFAEIIIYSAPEAFWVRVFDPVTPLLFNLYQYFEQNGAFGLVPEHATVPSSQVLPGARVRHPLSSKKILVRYDITIYKCRYSQGEEAHRPINSQDKQTYVLYVKYIIYS